MHGKMQVTEGCHGKNGSAVDVDVLGGKGFKIQTYEDPELDRPRTTGHVPKILRGNLPKVSYPALVTSTSKGAL